MAGEEGIQQRLQELQKQLGKKQLFEQSVSTIRSLLQHNYSSASPKLRQAVCICELILFFFRFGLHEFIWAIEFLVLFDEIVPEKEGGMLEIVVRGFYKFYFLARLDIRFTIIRYGYHC